MLKKERGKEKKFLCSSKCYITQSFIDFFTKVPSNCFYVNMYSEFLRQSWHVAKELFSVENTLGNSSTEHQWAKTKIQFYQDKHNKYIQVQKSVAEIWAGRDMPWQQYIQKKKKRISISHAFNITPF